MLKEYSKIKLLVGFLGILVPVLLFFALAKPAQAEWWSATYISENVPSAMVVGQTYNVSVTMRNDSDTYTWCSYACPGINRLGISMTNPEDVTVWGPSRVDVPYNVGPGQTVTFNFTITAPNTPGDYNFQWEMVWEGWFWYGWQSYMNGTTPPLTIHVDYPSDNSQYWGSSGIPSSMMAGTQASVSIGFTNTGNTVWEESAGGQWRLGNVGSNVGAFGTNRAYITGGIRVMPGGTYSFTFTITAPSTPGTYSFDWQMVHEIIGQFGPISPHTILVSAASATITADSTAISPGTGTTIRWSSSGTTSCTVTPGNWTGTSGSHTTGTLTASTTYTINCTGASATASVTVWVTPTCTSATPDNDWTIANTGTRRTYANGVANATSVIFYGWSDPGGQDDIIAYFGVNDGGGVWHADINLASHLGLGAINVHVYTNNAGLGSVWCDTANLTRLSSGNITVSSPGRSTSWTITCPLLNCPTQSGSGTAGSYTSVPSSTWTITPAEIPGYTWTVTPNKTQTGP